MPYHISLSSGWMDGDQFLSLCSSRSINTPTRMILLADGLLTRLLNALLLSPITLQRLRQEEATLNDEMAEYIETEGGQKVIDRDVWLMNGNERLVYANSILPISLMRDDIYNEITNGDTPIGTLLNDQSVLTRRDRLQIATVKAPGISVELGLPEGTELWARRYRLNTEGGFKGAILEVFSPRLFEAG
ncbi:MAG: chorismate lyase [Deltaproteobacteria bacterium]